MTYQSPGLLRSSALSAAAGSSSSLGSLAGGLRRVGVRLRLELRCGFLDVRGRRRCGVVRCRRRSGVDNVDGLTRGRIAFEGCHGSQSSLKRQRSLAEHPQHQLGQAQVDPADQRHHEGQEHQHHVV